MLSASELFVHRIPSANAHISSKVSDLIKGLNLNTQSHSTLFFHLSEEELIEVYPILSSLKNPNELLRVLSQMNLNATGLADILSVLPYIRSFTTLNILKNLNLPYGVARDVLYLIRSQPELETKIFAIFKNRTLLFSASLERRGNKEKKTYTLSLVDTLKLAAQSEFFFRLFVENETALLEIIASLGKYLHSNEITKSLHDLSKVKSLQKDLLNRVLENHLNENLPYLEKFASLKHLKWIFRLLDLWKKFLVSTLPFDQFELFELFEDKPSGEEAFIHIFTSQQMQFYSFYFRKLISPIHIVTLAIKSDGFKNYFAYPNEESYQGFLQFFQKNDYDKCLVLFNLLADLKFNREKLIQFVSLLNYFQNLNLSKEVDFRPIEVIINLNNPLQVIDILSNLNLDVCLGIYKTLEREFYNTLTTSEETAEAKLEDVFNNPAYTQPLYSHSPSQGKLQDTAIKIFKLKLTFENKNTYQLTRTDAFLLIANSPFFDALLRHKRFFPSKDPYILYHVNKNTISICLEILKNPLKKIPLKKAAPLYRKIHHLYIPSIERLLTEEINNFCKKCKEIRSSNELLFLIKDNRNILNKLFLTILDCNPKLLEPFKDQLTFFIYTSKTFNKFKKLIDATGEYILHIQLPKSANNSWLQYITNLQNLHSLHVENRAITGAGLAYISNFEMLTNLSLINLPLENTLSFLEPLTRLTSLQLTCSKLSKRDLFFISSLVNLESLSLSCSFLESPDALPFESLKNLKSLTIQNNYDLSDSSFEFLKHLKHLRKLSLKNCHAITGSCFEFISPSIDTLNLTCPYLKDSSLEILSTKNLKNLSIAGSNYITDGGLLHLSKCNLICDFEIEECENISEKGLCILKHFPLLTRLYLNYLNISNDILDYMENLTQLRELTIKNTSQFCGQGIFKIKKLSKLAHLDIDFSAGPSDAISNLESLPHMRTLLLRYSKKINKEEMTKKLEVIFPNASFFFYFIDP